MDLVKCEIQKGGSARQLQFYNKRCCIYTTGQVENFLYYAVGLLYFFNCGKRKTVIGLHYPTNENSYESFT